MSQLENHWFRYTKALNIYVHIYIYIYIYIYVFIIRNVLGIFMKESPMTIFLEVKYRKTI